MEWKCANYVRRPVEHSNHQRQWDLPGNRGGTSQGWIAHSLRILHSGEHAGSCRRSVKSMLHSMSSGLAVQTHRSEESPATRFRLQDGFSLIETMIVVAVITIIMASVFKSINLTQQTSASQQVKLDLTQQTRALMDTLTRCFRRTVVSNLRNLGSSSA